MSYNDLSTVKTINGIPVDLNYFSKVVENDAFLKAVSDADEDMSALNSDIIPLTGNTYKLGNNLKYFASSYITVLNSNVLNLLSGSLASPSLMIGNIGFASIGSGELSIIPAGVEALKILGSGIRVKGANNFQLGIENTDPSSLAAWYLGVDNDGLRVASGIGAESTKLLVNSSYTKSVNPFVFPLGSSASPSITFEENNTTGLYKTTLGIGASVNSSTVLEVTEDSVESKRAFKQTKIIYDIEGLAQEINVTGVSKILLDTTDGDIELKGLIGGQEGQLLYLLKKVQINNLIIKHSHPEATQSIFLKGNLDYTLPDGYGGIILSFDDGVWREVSRS